MQKLVYFLVAEFNKYYIKVQILYYRPEWDLIYQDL